jgi:hypothetical protein
MWENEWETERQITETFSETAGEVLKLSGWTFSWNDERFDLKIIFLQLACAWCVYGLADSLQ